MESVDFYSYQVVMTLDPTPGDSGLSPPPSSSKNTHPIFKLLKAEDQKKNLECSHLKKKKNNKKRRLRGKTVRMTGLFITKQEGHEDVAHFSHAEKKVSPEASLFRNICL